MAAPVTIEHVPPDVKELFEKLCVDVWRAGIKHYAAKAILERLRWHYHVERGDRDFMFNNNWAPLLARWFLERHPDKEGFFELRVLRASIYRVRSKHGEGGATAVRNRVKSKRAHWGR